VSLCSNCKILTIPTKEKSFVKLNDKSSVVGIENRLRAGRSGFSIPVGERYFSLLQNVWTGSGANLATYPVGISRRKADLDKVNLSPSAQIKNSCSYMHISTYKPS
jgi:hypothetical protein